MNEFHKELKVAVKKNARPMSRSEVEKLAKYLGTAKTVHSVGTESEKRIVTDWIKNHPDLSVEQYSELLDSLFSGECINDVSLAAALLRRLPKLRKQLNPDRIDDWLENLQGWAEVDSLCQSKFSANEILFKWTTWRNLLTELALDNNVHKKRASLVLLTMPIKESEDSRLVDMAFRNIDRLKGNREILVTKAISWLLRDLTKHNRRRVEQYLSANEDLLPKIALRETRTKLRTGRKTPKRPPSHE